MQRSSQLLPQDAEVFNNLGVVLRDIGRLSDSVGALSRSIKLKPNFAQAYSNLASTLNDLASHVAAEQSARKAISLKPDYAKAYNNLGSALKAQGKIIDAIQAYSKAIEFDPIFPEAYSNLGEAHKDIGNYQKAEICYTKAIESKNYFFVAYSNYLFSLNYRVDYDKDFAYHKATQFGALVNEKPHHVYETWSKTTIVEDGRIAIGFVSGDLRTHPVAYFLMSLVKHIDKKRFKLVAFASGPRADDTTIQLKNQFDDWIDIFGMDDANAASRIHATSVDVLIDLSGHTGHNRLPLFSYRPAPTQITWLGYFATTGLKEIDYIIADKTVLPEEDEPYFTEDVCRLAGPYFCFDTSSIKADLSPLPALKNGYFTFGCFNNMSKLNLRVIKLWSSILVKDKTTRLYLKCKQLSDPTISRNLLLRFVECGVEEDRISMEGQSTRQEYLEAYSRVDVALDPFPFPGGTTSVEGMWMGVPVITLKGDRFIGRNGETIAMHSGQESWIAKSEEEYTALALYWSKNLDALSELRRTLRARLEDSPLFDGKTFSIDFMHKIEAICDRRGVGRPPSKSNELIV
jgi:predicted O-linked N-acetylglucosamine transferase (SPINDLY family)